MLIAAARLTLLRTRSPPTIDWRRPSLPRAARQTLLLVAAGL
jgi:hypothetical protein